MSWVLKVSSITNLLEEPVLCHTFPICDGKQSVQEVLIIHRMKSVRRRLPRRGFNAWICVVLFSMRDYVAMGGEEGREVVPWFSKQLRGEVYPVF